MLIAESEAAEIRETAHALADAAARVTLAAFRQPSLTTDNKAGSGFDPVTEADRAAEAAMRAILATARPNDAIVGEEEGATGGHSGLTWVLDPIDGTRGFIAGTPTWGTLIAISNATGPLYGVIDQPWTGERFEGGFGYGALRHRARETPLRTRRGTALSQAVLFTTYPEVGTQSDHDGFRAVADRVRLVRYGMDCYAYALLAAGHVDLVIEAGLQPYDIAAPIAVVVAAGGVVTDWRGGPAQDGGQVIAAADPVVHAAALDHLRPFAAH